MSQVVVNDIIRYFVLALIVLLVISLVAVIRTPSSPPGQAESDAQEPAAQPEPVSPQPEPVSAQPLPRRSPAVTADLADDYPGRHVRTPRVSGQPPWGPAPRPPGLIP